MSCSGCKTGVSAAFLTCTCDRAIHSSCAEMWRRKHMDDLAEVRATNRGLLELLLAADVPWSNQ